MRPHPWKSALPALVALGVLLSTALHAAPPARSVKIAVLTPGVSFSEVLAGLREGLGQLGYREDTNLTILVEDTKGRAMELQTPAEALVAPKPAGLGPISTPPTAAAKARAARLPTALTRAG